MDNNEILNKIFEKIEASDSIVVFGHMKPDGDCVGSVMGCKKELQYLFPNKKIYAVGTHPSYLPQYIEPSDDVDDETIKRSLALMVDLSDIDRVEDQRIKDAKDIVCFDHHVSNGDREFLVYRDELAPSATAILTECFLNTYGELSKEAADYFYLGLITDSGRFQYDSSTKTFEIAGKLIQCGADYKRLYHELYKQTSRDLKVRSYVYDNYVFDGLVCYIVIKKEDYHSRGLEESDVAGKVNLLAQLDDHPIWVFFLEQEDGIIRVEFRSDGTRNVQKAALAFGGGGHFAASGTRITDFSKVKEIVDYLNTLPEEQL